MSYSKVLRLWDSLLSDETRCDLLIDVSTAMICLVRDELLVNDFATNMKLLQNYPITEVHLILARAAELAKTGR